MTKWSNLWVKPANMIAMGVEVRTADWLEQVEQEGYKMEAQIESILRIVDEYPDVAFAGRLKRKIKGVLGK